MMRCAARLVWFQVAVRFFSKRARMAATSVRVLARLKPLFSDSPRIARVVNSSILLASDPDDLSLPELEFAMAQCFGEDASQDAVAGVLCEEAITDVLRGLNVTVLAYGQTGSGKTHTMMGNLESARDRGVIPRLAHLLFARLPAGSKAKVTFVEIYKESLRDLLDVRNAQPVRIREVDATRVTITGAAEEACACADDVMELLRRGSAVRSVGSTRMNQDSSRSHSVLTVNVETLDTASGAVLFSKLVLVDLAGSEAVKKTLASGERLEEAKSINQSLSALGNVIGALVDKRGHVPYRDSKLTRLLQDSLGGTAKTTLIVNLSPALDNFLETQSTLRFGQRAMRIENHAVVNVRRSADVLERLLREAEERICVLEARGQGAPVTPSARAVAFTSSPSSHSAAAPPSPPAADSSMQSLDSALREELAAKLVDVESELELAHSALAASRNEGETLRERARAEELARTRAEALLGEAQLRERKAALALAEAQDEVDALKTHPRLSRRASSVASAGAAAASAASAGATAAAASAVESMEAAAVAAASSLVERDVEDLFQKCVRLQLALAERDEELAAAREQHSGNWGATWKRLNALLADARTHAKERAELARQVDELAAAAAMAGRKLENRQQHIDMLETVVRDLSESFQTQARAAQEREDALEAELAQYKRIFDRALAAKARAPVVASRTNKDDDDDDEHAHETAIVPFSLNNPLTNLKLLPERLFTFRGRTVRVAQNWVLDGRGGTELGFGSAVYPAGAALADCIGNRMDLRGMRVLELGCGVGVIGLACALAGAESVCATDGDHKTVALAEGNIAANGLRERVHAKKLMWGDSEALAALKTEFGPFDIVVGSDIVALPYVGAFAELARTIDECGAPRMLLAYAARHACEEAFFQGLSAKLLEREPVELAVHADFAGSGVQLLDYSLARAQVI